MRASAARAQTRVFWLPWSTRLTNKGHRIRRLLSGERGERHPLWPAIVILALNVIRGHPHQARHKSPILQSAGLAKLIMARKLAA